jgi:phosphoribosylformylglycinamidine synthase subunit PurL
MWQFSQVIDGMTKACEELEVPITGGNVSFYNETLGEGIYPTPVVGVVGIIEQVAQALDTNFKQADRSILLLRGAEPGDATDAEAEFGSSEYAKEVLGAVWGFPPALELEREAALQKCLIEMVREGVIESAHDCSDGGVAVALAEAGFRNVVGVKAELDCGDLPWECVLFGEDASRVVVSCDPLQVMRIKQIGEKYGVAADSLGTTTPGTFEVLIDGKLAISSSLKDLKDGWSQALERSLHAETEERLVPSVLERS